MKEGTIGEEIGLDWNDPSKGVKPLCEIRAISAPYERDEAVVVVDFEALIKLGEPRIER